MKFRGSFLLLIVTLVAIFFLIGYSMGMNSNSGTISVSYITETKQTVSQVVTSDSDTPVNINTATIYELMTLPGIGQTLGQRIIDYRNSNGAFQTIYDLLLVEGIGESTLEDIITMITTGGTS